MEDLFLRDYWKEATQPTRLHTPKNPFNIKIEDAWEVIEVWEKGSRKPGPTCLMGLSGR